MKSKKQKTPVKNRRLDGYGIIHIVIFFFCNFPSYTEKYTLCPLKIFYIFENFMLN